MKVHQYKRHIPPVEEIGPELYRTSIPQPFYAPNNIYILNGPEPAIIDSGYVQNLGLLQRSLRQIGLSLAKIKHVFYTHNHVDHISAAIVIRYYSKAKLYGMAGMAEHIGHYGKHLQEFERAVYRLVYKALHDQADRKARLEKEREGWQRFFKSISSGEHKVDPLMKIDVGLVEGDVISIGDREIGFLHTPGHNNWHLTPYILGEGVYFTGDLVLENVSSIYAELDGDLGDYHRSLERLLNMPIKRLLPAHGKEPEDPKRAIKVLKKTLALLERGVIRRLKEGEHDLQELALAAMGEKIQDSSHYVTGLAIIHAIIQRLIQRDEVGVHEVDPPYERYYWR